MLLQEAIQKSSRTCFTSEISLGARASLPRKRLPCFPLLVWPPSVICSHTSFCGRHRPWLLPCRSSRALGSDHRRRWSPVSLLGSKMRVCRWAGSTGVTRTPQPLRTLPLAARPSGLDLPGCGFLSLLQKGAPGHRAAWFWAVWPPDTSDLSADHTLATNPASRPPCDIHASSHLWVDALSSRPLIPRGRALGIGPGHNGISKSATWGGQMWDTSFLFRIWACRMSSVARGSTDRPSSTHRLTPVLWKLTQSARNSDFKHHLPVWPVCRTAQAAGAALLTSDPWPTNRNKVNISWAGVAEGGPENKSDPTSPEGDEWPPFQAGALWPFYSLLWF